MKGMIGVGWRSCGIRSPAARVRAARRMPAVISTAMTLVEFSVRTPAEFVEPLSQLFRRYGEGGVVIEQDGGYNPDEGETQPDGAWVTMRTYVPSGASLGHRRAGIDAGVRLIAHVGPVGEVTESTIEESDWRTAHTRHLGSLVIGKRLFVVPTWERCEVPEEREVIRLEPGLAFGTGHHPTTAMCLKLIEDVLCPGSSVLDLGCGSGILSIAAAKLGAANVLGLDVDAQAVSAARANMHRNGVGHVASAVEGTLPDGAAGRGFDLVVANISSTVVIDLAQHMTSAVRTGGSLLASGMVVDKRPQVTEALEAAGLSVDGVTRVGDWLAFRTHH